MNKDNRQIITEDVGEMLPTETSQPEQANIKDNNYQQALESTRYHLPETSPDYLRKEHFTNDLDYNNIGATESDQHAQLLEQIAGQIEIAEQAQEGLSPEEIRLEVLRKIQQLCLDEEIYKEFQLFLDEREVERINSKNERYSLEQQAQHIDDDINFQSDADIKFPDDYPTEDLYSVYNRLYSHAMYKKRYEAESSLSLLQARKISKNMGEKIGNRLYKEHQDRQRRQAAKVLG